MDAAYAEESSPRALSAVLPSPPSELYCCRVISTALQDNMSRLAFTMMAKKMVKRDPASPAVFDAKKRR